MTRTNEERITSLEEAIDYLKEGMKDVKDTLNVIIEKLDGRYPTKESVEFRIQALNDQQKELEKRIDCLETKVAKVQKWQYTVGGGAMVVGFLVGIISHVIKIS